jgi:hypothetical protein
MKLTNPNFLKVTLMVVIFILPQLLSGKGREKEQVPSLKGKKVLYVYGGWEGHEPKQSVDVFVPWMRSEGAEVVVSSTLDSYLDEKLMDSVDLIVQIWTTGGMAWRNGRCVPGKYGVSVHGGGAMGSSSRRSDRLFRAGD